MAEWSNTVDDESAPREDIAKIPRNYLHEGVVQTLRALIETGELKPRQRLNEVELAQRFGISRTPLREAIKILATDGLLVLLPNRGAHVASISEKELEELLEVIAGLDATAGRLACDKITAAEVEVIVSLHEKMEATYAARDLDAYLEINRKIHEAIMAAARNTRLSSVYANVAGRVQRTRYAATKTPEQWLAAMVDHRHMIPLLQKRDGEALGNLLRAHVMSKKPVILASYGAGTAR